jgi:hypothetical protein
LLLTARRVGEPSSSSCPPNQDDEEQERVIVTRTLARLNKANGDKIAHQKEKQQKNNCPSSRRSYPKPNTSFYLSHKQNHAYPSVPPEQAMYHMWHRVQTTPQPPHFPMVPTMGNTRFPPAAAMLSMYPPPRGQFTTPASQDSVGILPCFPEATSALPRYFSPYPISYVPRSPFPATVHRNHGKRREGSETVGLPDAAVFSQYTLADSSCISVYDSPLKVEEQPKHEEDSTVSSVSSEAENKSPLTASSTAAHLSLQKFEPNEDKGTLSGKPAESKKPQDQPLKSSPSWGPSVPLCGSVQQKHYSVTVQHDEPNHRNNHPWTCLSSPLDLWSSHLQAAPGLGTAVPVNSPGSVYQQRPPWMAAPVTVRTAVPVCSARPNVVNTPAGTIHVRPNFQNHSAPARGELGPHRNDDERNPGGGGTASLDLNKLHI